MARVKEDHFGNLLLLTNYILNDIMFDSTYPFNDHACFFIIKH